MAREARIPERVDLGTAVRARRLELGLRVEDVASRSGLSFSSVLRIERGGETTTAGLIALAAALETSVSALLGEAA